MIEAIVAGHICLDIIPSTLAQDMLVIPLDTTVTFPSSTETIIEPVCLLLSSVL
jgi:hypothetical protein